MIFNRQEIRKNILISCAFIVLSYVGHAQVVETISISGNTIEDARIGQNVGDASEANTNYGSADRFKISAWQEDGNNTFFRSLIKFDLSAIPADAVITSATLTLKSHTTSTTGSNSNDGGNALYIEKITQSWAESTVTWNNKPNTTTTGRLSVAANTDETETVVLDVTNFAQSWYSAPSSNHGVMIKLQNETKFRSRNFGSSDHATKSPVLSITYSYIPKVNTYPYSESWESNPLWYSSGLNVWTKDSGGTPTTGTGPTTGSSGSFYMFTESTNASNQTFNLLSPEFTIGTNALAFLFDYHMYGATMGTLHLEVSEDGTNWTSLWNLSGNQGDQWTTATVNLFSYLNKTVQFRFRGITGNGFTSDMAVDNIRIQLTPPSVPTAGTNGERVGSGSVTLTVNPVPGATGYKWYSTPTGGTPIATTATGTYQTASLTYTTPYYVSAYNAAGESASRYAMQATIKPQVTFPGATALAMGQSVTLQAPAGYDSYAWKNAQASIIGTAQTMEISTAGTYTLEATKSSLMTASEPIVITSAVSGQNRNYIVSTTIKVPGITDPAQIETLTVQQRAQQIQYFDGLGRPMQTVVTMGSPTMQDIISPVEYDAFGRQAKQHLPYTLASTAPGTYDASWAAHQAATYNTLQAGETTLYAETRFEASPLNRVLEQAAPGNAWKMSTGKTVKFSYQINTAADEVRLWKVQNDLPTSTGFYPTGQLYKNVTTDEDGNQSMEFTNKQGQTVLKRVMVDVVSADTTWADTYYVYDIYGLKRVVWQPQGVQELKDNNWEVTPLRLKNWAFTYQYDGRNREIARQVPGADTVYTVYDRWDRVVLTQDGNQREADKWLFMKYDALNRPILTGIMTSTADVATLRTTVMSTTQRYETFDDEGTEGYTNVTYPTTSIDHYLMVTYYDTYDFTLHAGGWTPVEWDYANPELTQTVNGHTYATPAMANTAVKGQVTGTKTRNLQTGQWLKTMQFYDDRYRTVQTITDNIRGERDRMSWLYDFTGQVLQELTAHNESDAPTNQNVLRQMTYDHGGRLTSVLHTLNDGEEVQLSAQAYNELSQMTAKTLINGFETMNYVFNIRGWLTDIMSGVFTQKMFYNQTDNQLGNTPMYNGNISAIRWSDQMMVAANPTRAYRYDYDAMGRLKAANHFEGNTATNNFSSVYTYDLNGNIGTLKRYGDAANLIDDMLYDYTNSGNRLLSVTDAATDTTTFHDRNTDGVDYGYDANGNMILDKNKKIDTIYYNHLNIPAIVVMEPVAGKRDSLVYHHDASGIKLRQDIYVNDSLIVKQEYLGDFYYENDTLKFINHEEGRVVLDMDENILDYQLNILDHLGNTRVTLSTTPKVYSFTATMEDANASSEEGIFQNITETRVSMAAANQTEGGIKAARIPNTDPIGPLTMLQVNKGDTVKLDAWAYYEGDGSTDGLISETALLAALVAGYSGATGIAEVSAQTEAAIEGGLDFPNNLVPKTNETNDDAPKAFINYMQFDEQMTFITSGFMQISTAAQFTKEHVVLPPITIDRNGFVMAYVSNESNQLNYVHFDDFTVTHSKTPVIYASSFEPFGLEFATFNRSYSQKVRYKFQAQELDETTRWYAFKYRNHDPVIGRFFNIDPLSEKYLYNSTYAFSENKVTNHVELEGLESADPEYLRESDRVLDGLLQQQNAGMQEGTTTAVAVAGGVGLIAGGIITTVASSGTSAPGAVPAIAQGFGLLTGAFSFGAGAAQIVVASDGNPSTDPGAIPGTYLGALGLGADEISGNENGTYQQVGDLLTSSLSLLGGATNTSSIGVLDNSLAAVSTIVSSSQLVNSTQTGNSQTTNSQMPSSQLNNRQVESAGTITQEQKDAIKTWIGGQ